MVIRFKPTAYPYFHKELITNGTAVQVKKKFIIISLLSVGEEKSIQDAKDGQLAMLLAKGAVHSADIEYAMGTLPTNRVYDWQPEDYWVSDQFSNHYANFIKTGNPNGLGLVSWPATNGKEVESILQLNVNSFVEQDTKRELRNKTILHLVCKPHK